MISSEQVRDLAARLITDDLVVLPVRHHSPACAIQVRRAIQERQPSVVLVEGPRSFTPLVPLLTDPAAVMPLAVYTYYAGEAGAAGDASASRSSAYYPFCDYSPELVALRAAADVGIPARFIDLDFAEQALLEASPDTPSDHGRSLLNEHELTHSRALQLLADRMGCQDQEDLWERLFEGAPVPLEEHVARVAAYCRLARADHSQETLSQEGTLQREAEMVWHVRDALDRRAPGDGPVLVVLGGFHAVVLPDLLHNPPSRPVIPTSDLRIDSALIRYTFDRLERLNGYGAGMTAPAWQQLLWEHLSAPSTDPQVREAAALVTVLDIAGRLRREHKTPVPMPAVAAAYGQALMLAELRGRAAPLRTDLLDGILSCFVKGDADVEGALIQSVAAQVLTGSRVGVVPPGAGTPPLVADTIARLAAQRLKVDGFDPQSATLDIYRRPEHRATSRLLHGLVLLGIPFARKVAGPDFVYGHGLGRLQERWDYHWSPASEAALVETSVLGTTLPEAVTTQFQIMLERHAQSGERSSSERAVALLAQACVLGLHSDLADVVELLRAAMGADPAFTAVVTAAARLALLGQAREPLETQGLGELPTLLQHAYARAIYLGHQLSGAAGEAQAIATALMQLRELLVGAAGAALDPELYWQLVNRVRATHQSAEVRGAATGLAYSAGRIDEADLGRVVTGQLSGTIAPAEAVAFVGGLLLTAREAAWQCVELIRLVGGQLVEWDEKTFVAHLPELRLAFASMTPVETDRVAQTVADLHGLPSIGPTLRRDVDEMAVLANLELSRRASELLERDGLSAWSQS